MTEIDLKEYFDWNILKNKNDYFFIKNLMSFLKE